MATSDTGELKSHEMLYLCMHACMQHGQRTEKELKSQLAGDKIGIEHKNPEMGAVGTVGGKPSLFEGCLAVVLYSTVLYKERKEIEVVYNYNYRLHSRSIHPEFPTLLSQKRQKQNLETLP